MKYLLCPLPCSYEKHRKLIKLSYRSYIPVTKEHFDGISSLVPTPEELHRIYPSAAFPLDTPQLQKLLEPRRDLTVLMDGQQIIAFANLYDVKPDISAFIGNVVVAKSHRGLGIGKALILHMKEICTNKYNAAVHLSVFNFNTNALLLYSNIGFIPYAVEQRFNLTKEPVALMHMKST